MHWLIDVHFKEDWCRVEDKTIQQSLNILRKAALNIIKLFRERTQTKRAIYKIMLDRLLNSDVFLRGVGKLISVTFTFLYLIFLV